MPPSRLLLLGALLPTLFPVIVCAQGVLVRVVGAETSEPIVGAMAYLLSEAGETVRTSLTDERGRALFVGVGAARYRVRAEMIGRSTAETDLLDATGGGTVAASLALEPRAISLEGVAVSAEARRCTVRPAAEGLLTARAWEEARKVLSAVAHTERQGTYRYETLRYVRELDPGSRAMLSQEEVRRQGYSDTPFQSRPAEDLITNGFVQRDAGELVYYAPDAAVLLSDAFLDTHCFRLVDGAAGSGLVGLGFEPTQDRRGVPEIAGTLWLDAQTAEPRWMDYTYRELGPDIGSADAGGRIDFQRMPSGSWIVPEWRIRMPIVSVEIGSRDGRRPTVTSLREVGGRVLSAREVGGREVAARGNVGGIEGVVLDSLGAPLAGVGVGVVGSNQLLFTDAEGRFMIPGLGEGVYQVQVVGHALERFGYVQPVLVREVLRGETSYAQFHLPSVAELLDEACEGRPGSPGSAVLVGSLSSTGGAPAVGASVQLEWSTWSTLDNVAFLREDVTRMDTSTDESGRFRFCAVPTDRALTLRGLVAGEAPVSDTLRIAVGAAGATHDLRLGR